MVMVKLKNITREENNELALLNQRLELIQNQIVQQNYNNIISPKSNINYKANVDYSKNIIKREQKVDYQKRNEEPKKENKELTKMLEEQNKRMEEHERNPLNLFCIDEKGKIII